MTKVVDGQFKDNSFINNRGVQANLQVPQLVPQGTCYLPLTQLPCNYVHQVHFKDIAEQNQS